MLVTYSECVSSKVKLLKLSETGDKSLSEKGNMFTTLIMYEE